MDNNDLTAKLQEVLSSPEAVDNLKTLAGSLFGDTSSEAPAKELAGGGAPDLSSLLSHLGMGGGESPDAGGTWASGIGANGVSPQDLTKMMRVFSAFNNQKEDDRSRLIAALKPHLSPERRERADRAAKLLKLAGLLPLIKETGLISELI